MLHRFRLFFLAFRWGLRFSANSGLCAVSLRFLWYLYLQLYLWVNIWAGTSVSAGGLLTQMAHFTSYCLAFMNNALLTSLVKAFLHFWVHTELFLGGKLSCRQANFRFTLMPPSGHLVLLLNDLVKMIWVCIMYRFNAHFTIKNFISAYCSNIPNLLSDHCSTSIWFWAELAGAMTHTKNFFLVLNMFLILTNWVV